LLISFVDDVDSQVTIGDSSWLNLEYILTTTTCPHADVVFTDRGMWIVESFPVSGNVIHVCLKIQIPLV
jgi:hypothetical protein